MGKNLDEGSVTAICALDPAKGFDAIIIMIHVYCSISTYILWFQ